MRYIDPSRLVLLLNERLLPLLPHKNRFFCFICVFLERNFKPIYYESEIFTFFVTDINVDKVYIDLAGEEKGKYTLEIQLPKEAFIGDFELD